MNTQTQEALKMAIEALDNACIKIEKWTKGGKWTAGKEASLKCKEALEQPAQEVGDAEIKQMLDDIEYYQKRIEELEQPAQEPVAWMRSALDNARDVCKYLDHDMIKEAKAHTKFFWDNIEKIKEPDTHPAPQPAQEPVAWMSKKRGDVSKAKMYFNEGEEILPLYTHPAPHPAQEPVAWIEVTTHHEKYQTSKVVLLDKGIKLPHDTLLYTHPAPSWQGLSDKEKNDKG